jgi:hypothetical protein
MFICQYCGRSHQTDVPDYRFCSTNCRQQQELFFVASGYTPDGNPTILDYSLTEADYLAHHFVAFSERAAQVVQEAEESDDEEAVNRKKDALLEDLARGNSVAEKIHRLTKPHSYSPGIGVGKAE